MASIDRTPLPGHLLAVSLAAVLAACSVAGPRQSPLPQEGPTLVDVYRGHLATEGANAPSPRDRLPMRDADDDMLTLQRRTDLSPLQQRFQRLPNPDLVMHVFPHLSRGRYPVPAYVTVFPMYEKVEYAMPGEVHGRQVRRTQAELRTVAPAPAASAVSAGPAPSAPTAPVSATPQHARSTECRREAGCSRN